MASRAPVAGQQRQAGARQLLLIRLAVEGDEAAEALGALVTAFPGRTGRGTGTWNAVRRFSTLGGTMST
jgi:hypothetical protein